MEEDFKNENFQINDFITKYFSNATENEIKDSILFISNTIQDQIEQSKELVTSHFDRFIECRSKVKEVSKAVNEHLFLENMTLYDLNALKCVEIKDIDRIRKKQQIMEYYQPLFDLKDSLENSKSYEQFVEINKKAYELKREASHSRFIQEEWMESDDLRKNFLFEMVKEIENKEHNFDEMKHFFEMYFIVEEMTFGSEDQDFKENKVENTILVNIKVMFENIFNNMNLIQAVKKAKTLLFKTFSYTFRNEIKDETMKDFKNKTITSLHQQNDQTLLELREEIYEFIGFADDLIDLSLKYLLLGHVNEINENIIEIYLMNSLKNNSSVSVWAKDLEHRIGAIMNEDDKNIVQEKVSMVIKTRFSNFDANELMFAQKNLSKKIKLIFQNDEVSCMKILEPFKDKENEKIQQEIEKLQEDITKIQNTRHLTSKEFFIDENTVPMIMMRILKTINEFPDCYEMIIKKVFYLIENKICKYFLKDICNLLPDELNDAEKIILKKYERMFGFLLKEKMDLIKETNEKMAKDDEYEEEKDFYEEVVRIDKKSFNAPTTDKTSSNINK